MEESFQRALPYLEENSGARLPNAHESLEGGDVILKFQLKMHEFMDFVNQRLKCGKKTRARQDKMIELFMMQGIGFAFSTKILAKVNMLSTSSGPNKVERNFSWK